jgi:hypothetical protein
MTILRVSGHAKALLGASALDTSGLMGFRMVMIETPRTANSVIEL